MKYRPNIGVVALSVLLLGLALTPAGADSREVIPSVVPIKAQLFPLSDVRLLPSIFQAAQDTDKAYLLKLNPDSLLAAMRQTSGLQPKAMHYGGWDMGGSGMIGHYLSAISQMAEATGDPELHRRVSYIIAQMAEIQKANGDGGLYSSQGGKDWFQQIRAGHVKPQDTTEWYTMHKTIAGVRDAWLNCGDAEARDVLIKLGDWAIQTTAKLTPSQWQDMLGSEKVMGEFGGPHEPLADIYAITGDIKYLKLAEKFRHNRVFDPMVLGNTAVLNGQHANAQIPKFVGYERIYELSGDPLWHKAALNFWNNVISERTWVNGGNSQWEHFFAPTDFGTKILEVCGPETCNTYNMLKLTQELYTTDPKISYIDYYERALYDHILPSEAPGGGFVYYTSMRPGSYRIFSRPYDAFWCCVGTGMENHGKYARMIYATSKNRLFVNLFIPSELNWRSQHARVRQETSFPEQPNTQLIFRLAHPEQLTVSIRRPGWCVSGPFTVSLNGEALTNHGTAGTYFNITRVWKTGDHISVALPMQVTTESLPGDPHYAAFLYGPVLLAGPLGTEGLTRSDFYGGGDNYKQTDYLATKSLPITQFPSLIEDPAAAASKLRRVPGSALAFESPSMSGGGETKLVPFYDLHFQRYAIYWPVK